MKKKPIQRKTFRAILSLASGLTLALSFIACSDDIDDIKKDPQALTFPQKIAIIDAGSSGSRLKVYEVYADSTLACIYPTTDAETEKSKGRALSTVANQEDSVKAYLEQMTACYTPSSSSDTIPLYVLATAGMRLQDESTTKGIYSKMTDTQSLFNGFKVEKAMTIAGRYEGLYAWITVNYESHSLTNNPQGILEVGGASMQVAFVSNATEPPSDYKITRNDWGTLYCRSYLGGGKNQIYANTPDTLPFQFTLPIEDIRPYDTNTTFYACSEARKVVEGIGEKGSFEAYVSTLPRTDEGHQLMTAYYVQWLIDNLHLTGRIFKDPYDIGWTLGAAYDIIINRQMPEAFSYAKKL